MGARAILLLFVLVCGVDAAEPLLGPRLVGAEAEADEPAVAVGPCRDPAARRQPQPGGPIAATVPAIGGRVLGMPTIRPRPRRACLAWRPGPVRAANPQAPSGDH